MKRKIRLVLIMLALLNIRMEQLHGQSQLRHWAISPINVNLNANPVVTPLSTFGLVNSPPPNETELHANSIYDDAQQLVFYISDGIVYDAHNVKIGALSPAPTNGELAIVPYSNNDGCQRKFGIYYMGYMPGISGVSVLQAEVDMFSFSVKTNTTPVIQFGFTAEEGGLAVSNASLNGDRFIYAVAGNGNQPLNGAVYQATIHPNGSYTPSSTIPYHQPTVEAQYACLTAEVDLSPDGQWLAWASYQIKGQNVTIARYHLININANGGFISYNNFDLPGVPGNTTGFRGVEFFQVNGGALRLFLGAGSDGIHFADVNNLATFTKVTNSNPFGNSQMELAFNGLMYACADNNPGVIDCFYPSILAPSILGGQQKFDFVDNGGNPIKAPGFGGPAANTFFYTLHDQIDDENYDNIAVSSIAQGPASYDEIVNAQQITWTYGSTTADNPWATSVPVHIYHELRISGNSHLTIDNMTFKFSPEARVVIEPGSTLTLNNGTILTGTMLGASCVDPYFTWQGVRVHGNSTLSQLTPWAQGKLVVTNNSRIEYAVCGAKNNNPLGVKTSGGIIECSKGATFYNCQTDVELSAYQNFFPTNGNELYLH
ncbi:MAG: hypothetical protein IPO27_13690 [Bacteroidetes bacterium]|nr:hypothetical protein [Bacteroidota bacterium]